MKYSIRIIILSFLVSPLFFITTSASGQEADPPAQPEAIEIINENLPLCKPAVYLIPPKDCLPFGPSEILTTWAKKGLTLPPRPLPASHPDASLLELDQKYAKLNLQPGMVASWYPNIESAAIGWGALSSLPPGDTLYVTFKELNYFEGNTFVQNDRNEWIRASPTNYSTFQGLLFDQAPTSRFGWIIDAVNPNQSPSINAPLVNEAYNRETIVQVYDEVEAEGTTWYMIGMNKWVNRTKIRVITPSTQSPEGVENGRWISIDLYQQTLTVYEDNQMVFATLVATGYEPYYTQPGLFQIREKKELETMTGAFATGKADYYHLENVPWTMYYDGPRALHGAYWRAMFGYEQSHGCVNLSIGDSHWLYDWAEIGDWVFVHDPSGLTPTDPALYQSNAAF